MAGLFAEPLTDALGRVLTIVNEMIDSAWLSCQIIQHVLKVFADVGILLVRT